MIRNPRNRVRWEMMRSATEKAYGWGGMVRLGGKHHSCTPKFLDLWGKKSSKQFITFRFVLKMRIFTYKLHCVCSAVHIPPLGLFYFFFVIVFVFFFFLQYDFFLQSTRFNFPTVFNRRGRRRAINNTIPASY